MVVKPEREKTQELCPPHKAPKVRDCCCYGDENDEYAVYNLLKHNGHAPLCTRLEELVHFRVCDNLFFLKTIK